jgi:short-subunit dehydrogenase involved in D-alanine esterification of teichoic acids
VSMVTDVSDADAIREMSDMQRRKFENDWRVNNAAMNQKLGEFQLLREELEEVSEIAFYARRFLSNRVVQITLSAAIIITLLGVFKVFWYAYQLAASFFGSVTR